MERFVTITELAEYMKLSPSSIRKFVLENTIPYIKIGGSVRFRLSDIEKWIEGQKKNYHLTAKNVSREVGARGER